MAKFTSHSVLLTIFNTLIATFPVFCDKVTEKWKNSSKFFGMYHYHLNKRRTKKYHWITEKNHFFGLMIILLSFSFYTLFNHLYLICFSLVIIMGYGLTSLSFSHWIMRSSFIGTLWSSCSNRISFAVSHKPRSARVGGTGTPIDARREYINEPSFFRFVIYMCSVLAYEWRGGVMKCLYMTWSSFSSLATAIILCMCTHVQCCTHSMKMNGIFIFFSFCFFACHLSVLFACCPKPSNYVPFFRCGNALEIR